MKSENFGSGVTLYNCDNKEIYNEEEHDFLFLDPPFNIYKTIKFPNSDVTLAFTNWQNRGHVTAKLGEPRIEMIWHFADGRWVSSNMPRLTHESILIYGKTGDANVGVKNNLHGEVFQKGVTAIGKDKLGQRIYQPKSRKQLNSVLMYPRNVGSELGVWSKPVDLLYTLFEFIDQPSVFDPFMGSATAAIAAIKLEMSYVGVEKEVKTFDIACKRVEQHLRQADLFVNFTR